MAVVLGAEVAEKRIGDVALEELGGPAFPFDEESGERLRGAVVGVAAHELGGGGRRAGAGVEQCNADFAAGKGAVEDGEISHDDGKEAEAGAAFENDERARPGTVRRDVAETEGEEGGSADVEVGIKVGGARGVVEGTAAGVVDEGETDDHGCGPDDEENDEREGTVVAKNGFALAGIVEAACEEDPWVPGKGVEDAGEAEAAGGAAGKDDGLEGIEEHDEDREDAGDQREGAHGDSLTLGSRWIGNGGRWMHCMRDGGRERGWRSWVRAIPPFARIPRSRSFDSHRPPRRTLVAQDDSQDGAPIFLGGSGVAGLVFWETCFPERRGTRYVCGGRSKMNQEARAAAAAGRRTSARQGAAKQIEMIGVPLDLGQQRRGVDMGPSALRVAGLEAKLEALGHHVTDRGNVQVPVAETMRRGDAHARFLKEIAQCDQEIADCVQKTLGRGAMPIVLGGDHSVAAGTVAGVANHFRALGQAVGLIWIDAHSDINTPETSTTGNVHGMPLAALLGMGPAELSNLLGWQPKVLPQHTVLVGIRDVDEAERENIRRAGITAYTMRDIDEGPGIARGDGEGD